MPATDQPAPGLAFWIHQVVEYLLGILVISQAAQTSRPLLPVLVGLAIIVLAATADGPVAAFHAVPRPVHRFLDLGMIAAMVLLLVFERDAMDPTGLLFIGLAALAMVGLLLRTSYRPKAPRAARSSFQAGAASVEPSTSPSGTGTGGGTKSESYGRAAGRVVGLGVRGLRNRKAPPAPPPPGSGS